MGQVTDCVHYVNCGAPQVSLVPGDPPLCEDSWDGDGPSGLGFGAAPSPSLLHLTWIAAVAAA